MVEHHLKVVLSSGLCIDNEDLVHVESVLGQIVDFNRSSDVTVRVRNP